jgi:hypothetical protein
MSGNLQRLCKVIRNDHMSTTYCLYVAAMRTVTAPGFRMAQGMTVQDYLDTYVRHIAQKYYSRMSILLSDDDKIALGKGMMHVALNTDYGKR